jgi:hypothetical protein
LSGIHVRAVPLQGGVHIKELRGHEKLALANRPPGYGRPDAFMMAVECS